jgi:hypothetical protein
MVSCGDDAPLLPASTEVAMWKWFGKRRDARREAQLQRDRKRARRQQRRGNPRDRKGSWDAEQQFITRFGDPFDDV